jgi:hypothetical protein
LFWGSDEAQFVWLLRRDSALLYREGQAAEWQRPILAWQRYRLDRAYRQFIRDHPQVASLRAALERKQAALRAGQPDTRPAIMRALREPGRPPQ